MVLEPAASSNQTSNSYNFITPIKLYQNNFIVWRTQVLTSIKGNRLESFITGENKCPDQYLNQNTNAAISSVAGSGSRIDNLIFSTLIKTNQLLLSRMTSLIQENLLSFVIHYVSSQKLWDSLTRTFVFQTQARIMLIKMQLQTAKKGFISISAYFAKMKRLIDILAITRKLVEHANLVTYILTGLWISSYKHIS